MTFSLSSYHDILIEQQQDRDVMRTAFLCQEALALSLTGMLACDPKV